MKIRGFVCSALAFVSLTAHSTEFIKESTLVWLTVQGARPIQTSTQNTTLINFATNAAWTNNGGSGTSPACDPGAASLPDNEQMRAVALTAIATGATVIVAVDNTLPMVGPYCQVTMLSISKS